MASGRESASRYEVLFKLASGGMATVYVGTARGAMGFRQIVAIKEPHPHLLDDKNYRRELVAEARLASMIHHVNVVDVRDVEASSKMLRLIMDYIEGASFGELLVLASKAGRRLPTGVVVRIALDACAGLHAAHELIDEKGRKVGLVHRDVSPQNILVGLDGTTRVSDFGVAKATAASVTSSGTLKGKIAYMAPEYVEGRTIDRRVDVFGLGVVVWEALAGKRLFRGKNEAETVQRILLYDPPPISVEVPELGTHFDAALATALAKQPEERFATAQAFAAALESSGKQAGALASHSEVAALVAELAGPLVDARRMQVRAKFSQEPGLLSLMGAPPPSMPPSSAPPSTKPERNAAPTLIDAPATLIDAPPLQLPPPVVYRSTEPIVSEVREETGSAGSDMEAAGVPRSERSPMRIVGVAILGGGIAFGVAFYWLHTGASPATDGSHPGQAATSSSSVSSAAPPSPPSLATEPLAPLTPVSASTHAPSPSHVAAKPPTSSSAPHTQATDGPPPNPY